MTASNLLKIILFTFLLFFSHYVYAVQNEDGCPLVVYDGKVFQGSLDDLDTTSLARISRIDSLLAMQVYGESGKNGAIILVSEEYLHPNIFVQIKKADKSTKICLYAAIILTIILIFLLVLPIRNNRIVTKNQTLVSDKDMLNRPNASIITRAIGGLIDLMIIAPEMLFVFFWQLFGPLCLCDKGLICLFSITWLIFAFVLSFSYSFFTELFFAKTIGKWVCRTCVVTENGSSLTAKIVAKRTWGRIVPNDVISFLFVEPDKNGKHTYFYHDLISQTRVVKEIK